MIAMTTTPGAAFTTEYRWEYWLLTPGILDDLAQFACDFNKPFWTGPGVFRFPSDDIRNVVLPDGLTTIVETSQPGGAPRSNTYHATGVPGISNYTGQFSVVSVENERVRVTWRVTFSADSNIAAETMIDINQNAVKDMTKALHAFPPLKQ